MRNFFGIPCNKAFRKNGHLNFSLNFMKMVDLVEFYNFDLQNFYPSVKIWLEPVKIHGILSKWM